MAKQAEKQEKATKKAEKEPTFCLVTGEPTKGGLFKPGMDARYVSMRVQEVVDGTTTEAKQRKRLKDDGVSERLVAKFDKALGLAREKAEKAKAAAAEAKAAKKAEAKAS